MIPGFPDPDLKRVEKFRAERDLAGLLRALRAQDIHVSEAAAAALEEMADDHTEYLLSRLQTKDIRLKAGIIGIFSRTRNRRAVPPLIGMLSDPAGEIRWEAAIALGEIGNPGAIAPLVAALDDRDKYVRFGAARALARLGWVPATERERAAYHSALQEWDAVRNVGVPAIPVLGNLFSDRDPVIRLKVVRTLGEMGHQEGAPLILRALRDENRDVRWQAVLASEHCGVPIGLVPCALSGRPSNRKSPLIAGFMNFMLPGLGYGYLGKWWGIMIFQIDITATVWLFRLGGETETYLILFPIYVILAIHAWYLAESMPEDPP